MVQEIAEAKGYSFQIATIKTAIERSWITQKVLDGKTSPCGPLDPLAVQDVEKAVQIVGQMGAEPLVPPLVTP